MLARFVVVNGNIVGDKRIFNSEYVAEYGDSDEIVWRGEQAETDQPGLRASPDQQAAIIDILDSTRHLGIELVAGYGPGWDEV